jgi:hypothetical protein
MTDLFLDTTSVRLSYRLGSRNANHGDKEANCGSQRHLGHLQAPQATPLQVLARKGTLFSGTRKYRTTELTLRKLEPLTRARLARFLAFPHSRIAGEKTFLLQRRPHCRILLQQRPRDSQSNCTGLPRNSPARRLYLNVKLVARFGHLERLQHSRLQ